MLPLYGKSALLVVRLACCNLAGRPGLCKWVMVLFVCERRKLIEDLLWGGIRVELCIVRLCSGQYSFNCSPVWARTWSSAEWLVCVSKGPGRVSGSQDERMQMEMQLRLHFIDDATTGGYFHAAIAPIDAATGQRSPKVSQSPSARVPVSHCSHPRLPLLPHCVLICSASAWPR